MLMTDEKPEKTDDFRPDEKSLYIVLFEILKSTGPLKIKGNVLKNPQGKRKITMERLDNGDFKIEAKIPRKRGVLVPRRKIIVPN